MIPAASTLTEIDSLPGEEIDFGIGDPSWVMRTQAELYSDVTTAIIREYSTNAYDAHIMSGNTNPIEVTLPSVMSPYFVVEDHGTGMSLDTFRTVYTQFGISNKRGSNKTNGLMGYGSKSGIAYTNQFTVTSVFNGEKIVGVVIRKPDWRIVLKVVSQSRTSEPNGTRIQIPVHNVAEFQQKAKDFYKFWLPGRVLVDGVEPEHHVGEKITDSIYYTKDWNTSYIVLGNVAYRINNPSVLFSGTNLNHINFVAYVDDLKTEDGAAAIEFTPSREDLMYTNRTKETLKRVVDSLAEDIVVLANKEISNASSHAEAFKAWTRWTGSLGTRLFSNLTYKGDSFQSDFRVQGKAWMKGQTAYAIRTWSVRDMDKVMVITDFDINLSSSVKAKANEFIALKGWDVRRVLFLTTSSEDITNVWVSREHFVSWSELKAALPKKVPAPRAPYAGTPKKALTFDVFNKDGLRSEQTIPDDTKNVFFVQTQDIKYFNVSVIINLIDKDIVVINVPANRLNKFKRENPRIAEFIPYAKSMVVLDEESLLSEDAKKVLRLGRDSIDWLQRVDPTCVDDPEWGTLSASLKNKDQLIRAKVENMQLARHLRMNNKVTQYPIVENTYIMRTYPLLKNIHFYRESFDVKDVYLYLNAAYAAK